MRRVTTRGNVHPHERPRARPSSPGPARRAIASRDADAARDPSTTPRDPSPAPRVASPTRRRIRARRIRARRAGAWNPSVARVSRAIRATRARFAIRDRPTGRRSRGGRARVEARVAVAVARRRARRRARRGTRRGRADRPRPTDRVFLLFTHTKRSPRVASSHCLPTRDGPLREATTPDTPSTRARRRQSTTTTTTTMLAQRAQAFATGGATVASRARARATRGRTGRRAQTRAGIPIHIEYCEK